MIQRLVLTLALFAVCPLYAGTHVWKGTVSNLFSDPRNWQGGSPAGDPEAALVFPEAVRQAVVNDLDALVVQRMTFEVDGYTIEGKAITLTEGAEIEAEAVEFTCDLHVEGKLVEKPGRGLTRYDATAPTPVRPQAHTQPNSSSSITISGKVASAQVKRGAEITWFAEYRGEGATSLEGTMDRDSDGDGIVSWEMSRVITAGTLLTLVDQTAGTIQASLGSGAAMQPENVPVNLLRDRDGNYTYIDVETDGLAPRMYILWLRPGVGAWWVSGYPRTTYQNDKARVLTQLRGLPIRGSQRMMPAGVLPGDFLVITAGHTGIFERRLLFAGRVDDRLEEAPRVRQFLGVQTGSTSGESSGTVTASVYRLGSTEGTVSAHYRTVDGNAKAGIDYVAVEGIVTFMPGDIIKTIDVPIIDNDVYDSSSGFGMELGSAAGATIRDDSAPVVIFDDDPLPVISVGETVVQEGDSGSKEVEVEVLLTGKTAVPATARWHWFGSKALQSLSRADLVFAPGETRKTLVFRYTADTTPAPDRRALVELREVIDARPGSSGALRVLDDDGVAIASEDVTVEENASNAIVQVTLSAPHAVPVSVDYSAMSAWMLSNAPAISGIDFVEVRGKLTFQPGQTTMEIAVPILEDDIAERAEQIAIDLTTATAGAMIRRTSHVTIRDDGDTPQVSVADTIVAEGAAGKLLITLSPRPEKAIPFVFNFVPGSAAANVDFEPRIFQVPGDGWYVVAREDDVIEPDETFTVEITEAANPVSILATAHVTIEDRTAFRPVLAIENASAREAHIAAFSVTLSNPSAKPVSFRVRTVGDTADAGTDFEPVSQLYTLEPGELGTKIEVRVLDDQVPERHETFAVELLHPWNAWIGRAIARGRIFDDDDPAVPVFSTSSVSVTERSGTAHFTISMDTAVSTRTTLSYSTADGTATASEDYRAAHGEVTFEPGETSKTIEIAIVNDSRYEEDETFTLRLANGLEATATILNDDAKARSRSVRH